MSKSSAVIQTPFGKLGICCQGERLLSLSFLANEAVLKTSHDVYTNFVIDEIQNYLKNSKHEFSINVQETGSSFQKKVWQALKNIPVGATLTYGELAKQLQTGPRAIGQACRTNPFPLIVPCHRVVAKHNVGGFSGNQASFIQIKNWLLAHESSSNNQMI